MVIDARIPLMAQGIDGIKMLKDGSELADMWLNNKAQGEMTRIHNESQGDLDKMLSIAPQSKYARWIMPQLQSQKAAQAKAALDTQKAQADISKTQSEAYKNTQQGGGYALDNSGKKLGAIQSAIQQAAITGDKTQALLALSGAQRSGLMSPEDYEYQSKIINIMTPDELKQYASGIVFSNAKDPSGILYQTANNVADNETSTNNNIRSTNASIYSTDVGAQTAADKLEQDQQQFEKNYAFNQQKQYFEQNKPLSFETGSDGYRYAVYANGKGIRVVGEDGQPIKVQQKAGNLTAQNAQREETQRLQRVDAILPEIEKILPNATSSYAGVGVDLLGRAIGYSTDGAKATAQLKTLAGQLVSLMPKMSGPQSDKDVAMYKEMAGNLADDTQPIQTRMAALQTIKELNNKYKGMNQQSGVPYANAGQQGKTPKTDPKIISQAP